MPHDPDHIQRLIAQAHAQLADDLEADPCEAASLCFEVLAAFPEHTEALALIQQAYQSRWLVRDNRKALSRLIDEWDDRAWQQRRRQALSFRYVSRWEGWHREYDDGYEDEREGPQDIRAMLEEGHHQLIHDYLVGDARGAEAAWQIFQEAIRRTAHPRTTLLWVGKQYAEQGYFAESVDVLEKLLNQFPEDDDARRLWIEVRWWRDNVYTIGWMPPPGDGNRYRRYLTAHHPDRLAEEEAGYAELRQKLPPPDPQHLPPNFTLAPGLSAELANQIESALPDLPPEPHTGSVDWHYLERVETGNINEDDFPEWARDMLALTDDPDQHQDLKEFLASYLADNPNDDEDNDADDGWESI